MSHPCLRPGTPGKESRSQNPRLGLGTKPAGSRGQGGVEGLAPASTLCPHAGAGCLACLSIWPQEPPPRDLQAAPAFPAPTSWLSSKDWRTKGVKAVEELGNRAWGPGSLGILPQQLASPPYVKPLGRHLTESRNLCGRDTLLPSLHGRAVLQMGKLSLSALFIGCPTSRNGQGCL